MMTAVAPSTQLQSQDADPPFSSAHAALVFTFNHTNQIYDRPMMARMASAPTGGGGKGLGGLDGAGQAGMIRKKIASLSRLHQAIIVARFAPRRHACRHCKGEADDIDWLDAIRVISDAAVCSALSSHLTSRALRDAIVQREFGKTDVKISNAASEAGASSGTATNHGNLIRAWLRGTRTSKEKGGEQGAGKIGEEAKAMEAITDILVSQGICK